MTEIDPNPKYHKFIKTQMIATALMSLVAAAVVFAIGQPLPRELGFLGLISAIVYTSYYLVFDRVAVRNYMLGNTVIGVIGVSVLSLSVHYTGGIVSPFVFMFFFMLLSEALYGLDKTYTLYAILAGYLSVVFGQYAGILPCGNSWAAQIYSSLPATLLIAGITVMYLLLTRDASARILNTLYLKLSAGLEEKNSLLRKFSELNATAQLGALAHHIAHDLRGPIASISGYLELARARARTPEERAELDSISATVENLVESLHGITRFGKTAGPAVERVCLGDFLKDLVAIAAFSPKARGVEFSVKCQEGDALCVRASRADLQQALFNVIKNSVEAVRANPDRKLIELAVGRSGADIVISVVDNGPGMPEEMLKDIFRSSVTTKADGTGVGLLITRDLLWRNGAEVKLRNRQGGGFSVLISLPAA